MTAGCRRIRERINVRLYAWQKECIRAWRDNDFHGIVNVVTGAGKTIMALYGARLLEKHLQSVSPAASLRVKVVVPTSALAAQWEAAMRTYLPGCGAFHQRPGFHHSERRDDPGRRHMIYVINSARYALARHILADIRAGFHVLLIADECHHYASPENQKIFDFLRAGADLEGRYHSLGLSATPLTGGGSAVLTSALGREIYQYGFSRAAREKHICDFSIFQVAMSFSCEEMEEYKEISEKLSLSRRRLLQSFPYLKTLDRQAFFAAVRRIAGEDKNRLSSYANVFLNLSYRRQAVTHMASSRISCALSLADRLAPREQILVFGERIQQAEAVYRALLMKYPNRVGCYHSGMTAQARKNILGRFRDGELRILVCCRALDEGIDAPGAGVGIVLSCTSVNRQRIQRLGRILRCREGKDFASLYYFYIPESTDNSAFLPDQAERFTLCDLSYLAQEDAFVHPAYEKAAKAVLSEVCKTYTDERLIREARRCLSLGLARSDWLMSEAACEERIRRAEDQGEKNYWICMRKMAKGR